MPVCTSGADTLMSVRKPGDESADYPLAAAFAASRDLVALVRRDGSIVVPAPFWQEALCERHLHALFVPADAERVESALGRCDEDGAANIQVTLGAADVTAELRLVRMDADQILVALVPGSLDALTLSAIVEHTAAGIALAAEDTSLLYLNDAYARIWGRERRLLLGLPCTGIIPASEVDAARAQHDDIINGRRDSEAREYPIIRGNGQTGTIESSQLRLRLPRGAPVRLSTLRDISERADAERSLRASEAQFRTLYNATPVMLHSIDAHGRIRAVNDHWLENLCYHREEVVGSRASSFFTAECKQRLEQVDLPAFWTAGEQRDMPYQIHRRDGSTVDVLLSANVLRDEHNEVIGGLAAMVDISERRRIEADYQDLFENASEGIYQSTPTGKLLHVNPALARIHGFNEPADLVAATRDIASDWYIDPDTRARLQRQLDETGRAEGFVAECRRIATGEHFWTSENVRMARDSAGELLYFEGTVRDITADRRAAALGRARGEILERIARDHPLTDILCEIVGTIEQQYGGLSAAIFRLHDGCLECAAAPALSPVCVAALDNQRPSRIGDPIAGAMLSARTIAVQTEQLPPGNALTAAMQQSGYAAVMAMPIRDQGNAVLGLLTAFFASTEDIIEEVATLLGEMAQMTSIAFEQSRLAEALLHQAHYDPLTNLPNRTLLNDRLQQAIADAERSETTVAVMLLDLDEFKLINDTLGHSAGDELLRDVAERLRDAIRGADSIARLGGDEFIVVAPFQESADISDAAERLLDTLQAPFFVGDQEVTARPSIGISLFPDDGDTPESLVRAADTAMYAAKQAGKNRYRFFAGSMNEQISERLRIESGLRRALMDQVLVLHYQPRIELTGQRLTGVECLLRWPQTDGTLMLPGGFLHVAERSSLISDIDDYVLERAICRLASWQQAGHALVLSLNLSARDLHTDGFGAEIARLIGVYAVDPTGLEIEITESMLMQDFAHAVGQLHDLKERAPGVRVAIDDFGSGYSSLNYLRHLPIDTLKIDRSFVADLDNDDDAMTAGAIIRTVVELGQNLGLNIVAEGVETERQANQLAYLGCHEAQGFWFAQALAVDEIDTWLQQASPPDK